MKLKSILSLFFIITLFTACGSNDEAAQVIETKDTKKEVKVAKSDTYTLKTTDGKTLDFEMTKNLLISNQLNGKIVLFNFWATWCPPCKKEMPAFVKLQEKYKDRFVVIGVLMEKQKDKAELKKFMDEYKINFPITVDSDNFKFAKDIGDVKMYPESYLFSKDGLLYKKFIGEVNIVALESYILDTE